MLQKTIQNGDVYWAKVDQFSVDAKDFRPCVVIQNNKGNFYSNNIIVIPLTTKIKKLNLPTHVYLPKDILNLEKDGLALCEAPVSIPKKKLGGFITHLPQEYLEKIAWAHIKSTGMLAYLKKDQLVEAWEASSVVNAALFA